MTSQQKQTLLDILRNLLERQEANLRHFENKAVEALHAVADTQQRIEELEAEIDAEKYHTQKEVAQ